MKLVEHEIVIVVYYEQVTAVSGCTEVSLRALTVDVSDRACLDIGVVQQRVQRELSAVCSVGLKLQQHDVAVVAEEAGRAEALARGRVAVEIDFGSELATGVQGIYLRESVEGTICKVGVLQTHERILIFRNGADDNRGIYCWGGLFEGLWVDRIDCGDLAVGI